MFGHLLKALYEGFHYSTNCYVNLRAIVNEFDSKKIGTVAISVHQKEGCEPLASLLLSVRVFPTNDGSHTSNVITIDEFSIHSFCIVNEIKSIVDVVNTAVSDTESKGDDAYQFERDLTGIGANLIEMMVEDVAYTENGYDTKPEGVSLMIKFRSFGFIDRAYTFDFNGLEAGKTPVTSNFNRNTLKSVAAIASVSDVTKEAKNIEKKLADFDVKVIRKVAPWFSAGILKAYTTIHS